MDNQETVKGIHIDPSLFQKKRKSKSTEGEPKESIPTPKKRIITNDAHWKFSPDQLNSIQHLEYIRQIIDHAIVDENPCKFIKQQIQQKLGGYKCQDVKKHKYDELRFIRHDQVLQLMTESENLCFYCKERVHVLYENVREPKQWTLERIDNEHGHNGNNVVIACLGCNLRRRTMHYERFLFTKQLTITKL